MIISYVYTYILISDIPAHVSMHNTCNTEYILIPHENLSQRWPPTTSRALNLYGTGVLYCFDANWIEAQERMYHLKFRYKERTRKCRVGGPRKKENIAGQFACFFCERQILDSIYIYIYMYIYI